MGRSSRFLFPLPGRKKPAIEAKVVNVNGGRTHIRLSKAQRILGIGEGLHTDNLITDTESLGNDTCPSSSGLSVTLSEVSTPDDELYNTRSWDVETEIYASKVLRGKASSTLLGLYDVDETDLSSKSLHKEGSNSTIRSHYDRQQVPLAVSQQTSASSTRDLALRKGFPPVTSLPCNLLAVVETPDVEAGSHLQTGDAPKRHRQADHDTSKHSQRSTTSPKTGHDVLPSSRSNGLAFSATDVTPIQCHVENRRDARDESSIGSADDMVSRHYFDGRNTLRAASVGQSRGQVNVLASEKDDIRLAGMGTMTSPEHRNSCLVSWTQRTIPVESHRRNQSPFDFVRSVKPSIGSIPWDRRSTTSSKRTTRSVFSDSDLRNDSVLSLSSDESSDEDRSSLVGAASTETSHRLTYSQIADISTKPHSSSTLAYKQVRGDTDLSQPPRGSMEKSPLTTSFRSSGSTRKAGPRTADRKDLDMRGPCTAGSSITNSPTMENAADKRSKPSPVLTSTSSCTLHIEDTRVMTVTKQEEALLEALRHKRARMYRGSVSDDGGLHNSVPSLTIAQQASASSSIYEHSNHVDGEQILPCLEYLPDEIGSMETTESITELHVSSDVNSGEDVPTSRVSRPRSNRVKEAGSVPHGSIASSGTQLPCVAGSAARLSAVGSMQGLSHSARKLQVDSHNVVE